MGLDLHIQSRKSHQELICFEKCSPMRDWIRLFIKKLEFGDSVILTKTHLEQMKFQFGLFSRNVYDILHPEQSLNHYLSYVQNIKFANEWLTKTLASFDFENDELIVIAV